MRRNLEALGLRPDRADKVPSFNDYLAEKRTTSGGNGHQDGAGEAAHTERS